MGGEHDTLLILFRRQTVGTFEHPDKIVDVIVSAGGGNSSDRERGGVDQRDGLAHPYLMDKIRQRDTRLFLKRFDRYVLDILNIPAK